MKGFLKHLKPNKVQQSRQYVPPPPDDNTIGDESLFTAGMQSRAGIMSLATRQTTISQEFDKRKYPKKPSQSELRRLYYEQERKKHQEMLALQSMQQQQQQQQQQQKTLNDATNNTFHDKFGSALVMGDRASFSKPKLDTKSYSSPPSLTSSSSSTSILSRSTRSSMDSSSKKSSASSSILGGVSFALSTHSKHNMELVEGYRPSGSLEERLVYVNSIPQRKKFVLKETEDELSVGAVDDENGARIPEPVQSPVHTVDDNSLTYSSDSKSRNDCGRTNGATRSWTDGVKDVPDLVDSSHMPSVHRHRSAGSYKTRPDAPIHDRATFRYVQSLQKEMERQGIPKSEQERIHEMRQRYIQKQRRLNNQTRTRCSSPNTTSTRQPQPRRLTPKEQAQQTLVCCPSTTGRQNPHVRRDSDDTMFSLRTSATASKLCVVCGIYERSHIAMPCMHFCLCEDCYLSLKERKKDNRCPVCNLDKNVSFTKMLI